MPQDLCNSDDVKSIRFCPDLCFTQMEELIRGKMSVCSSYCITQRRFGSLYPSAPHMMCNNRLNLLLKLNLSYLFVVRVLGYSEQL